MFSIAYVFFWFPVPVLIGEIFALYYLLFLSVVRSSLFVLLFWLQIFPNVD